MIIRKFLSNFQFYILIFAFLFCLPICRQTFCILHSAYAQDKNMNEGITVNGDTVEFSTERKEVTATGNVEVTYKGTKLTCEKLTVNSQTKEGQAEGNPRLDSDQGVIEGSKIIYNFNTKAGVIFDSDFRANPFFGKAEKTEKVSDAEFISRRGYFTTCNYEDPHYRMKTRKINMFPGERIEARNNTLYLGRIPLFYLPEYKHSFKDPIMRVQFMPGKSKEWGPYLLTAWRYTLTQDITGRIYFDWREKLGVSEGFGTNYKVTGFGKGDFKYYYTQERNHTKDFPEEDVTLTKKFQRYLIRLRHKADIDDQTNVTLEYYKITDSKRALYPYGNYNFLKEFFMREYEKDSQPLSYALGHHSFKYSSIDFMMQKRVNRWYSQLEELPKIQYSLPEFQIGESPIYFDHASSAANFNYKNAVPSPSTDDKHSIRFDMTNKVSLPFKLTFINLDPFVTYQGTYYRKDVYGSSTLFRTVFYTGADASTKFYRIFNIKSNFLMDINGLRHIITPTIAYTYNNKPTIPAYKLVQIDSVDAISSRSNSAALSVSNILQTKRNSQTVDFFDLLVSNTYTFKTENSSGSSLGDFIFKLKFLPYSWLTTNADANYNHHQDCFTNVSYDINLNLGKDRSLGFNQRYQRKGPIEYIYSLKWYLNPKWKFSVYNRWVTGHHDVGVKRGLREQEYVLSRDFHCWTIDTCYNVTRDKGESIWFVFRLKAFPEMEFEYNQDYHRPKPGEQTY